MLTELKKPSPVASRQYLTWNQTGQVIKSLNKYDQKTNQSTGLDGSWQSLF